MRNRLGAASTAGLVLVAGLAGVAMAAFETVADDFSSSGYGGSTGTMDWAGSWVEVGESDGPGSGAVQVQTDAKCASGPCLTIDQLLGGLTSMGAMRSLDLSEATSASLSYHIDFPGGLLLDGSAEVEARAGGGGWTRLHSYKAGTAGNYTADLPVGHVVDIRFRAADLALTAGMAFDDVSIEVDLLEPTTTSSTSTTTSSTTTSTTAVVSITPPTIPTITLPTTPNTTLLTTSTTTLLTTPTTTGQGDDPPASGGEPTTTVDRDRPPDDPDTTTTTSEHSAEGEASTTTTSAEDGDAMTPSATTLPGTNTHEAENTPEPEGASVVTDFDPGFRSEGLSGLGAQDDLLVVFGRAVEDIALDLLASAVLGLVLAWASLRRLG